MEINLKMAKKNEKVDQAENEAVREAAETEETALTISEDSATALDTPQSFVPSAREQAEMIATVNALRQELEDGIGETTQPTVLADSGVVFDIVDAYMTTMQDDQRGEVSKVMFHVVEQETGIEHRVMQSDDSKGIRRKYAQLFGFSKAMNIPTEPLVGYQFVYGTKIIAGNKAIILQRVPQQLKSANA